MAGVSRIRILLAADRMTAEAQVAAGEASDAGALHAALAAAGVTHGIDEAATQALGARLRDPQFAGKETLARGTPPQQGEDGRFEPHFDDAPMPGFRSGDDALDYRERGFLHPAAQGATLGTLHPPTQGTGGTDCTGKPALPRPTKPFVLRAGAGASVGADGRVTALRDGVVALANGGIDVLPLFVHKGDITLRTGNLHTHGSLQITGDVGAGFAVEADGDVDVQGCAYNCSVRAGGNVRVGLGVQQGSRIEADGDIRFRHATASTLLAKGAVVALDELVRCDVVAREVHATQGRGCVLGGSLRARDKIAVIQAGADSGAPTLLAAADLASESAEILRLNTQLDRAERQAHKAAPRAMGPARGGKVGREQTAAQDAALREKVALAQRQREILATATIEVQGVAHPGVRIRLGAAERTIEAATRGVRYRWDPDKNAIAEEST